MKKVLKVGAEVKERKLVDYFESELFGKYFILGKNMMAVFLYYLRK
jgi:hypothetical protein